MHRVWSHRPVSLTCSGCGSSLPVDRLDRCECGASSALLRVDVEYVIDQHQPAPLCKWLGCNHKLPALPAEPSQGPR